MNVGFRIPAKAETEVSKQLFDLRKYLNFVWRNWAFIASVTAFALVLGIVQLLRATPLYTATVQVLIAQPQNPPTLGGVNDGRTEDVFSYAENQLAILRSDSLLRRVVIKERLVPTAAKESQPGAQNQEDQAAAERAIQDEINRLRGALAVSRNGAQAQVFNISITWEDSARAAQLANAVADAYAVDQLDARLESAKRASGWLSDRIVDLRRQLSDSEESIAKFREEHGLTRTGPTVALNEQQLSDLNSKLIAARTDAAEKKARADFLADLTAGKKTLDALPESFLSTFNVITALRTKLTDISQRKADLLARYNNAHPAVVNIEAEKRDVERSIAVEKERVAQTVQSDYALAKARLNAMEQAMREATGQGELSNDDTVKLRELERTAAVNKTLFEEFLQKAKITDEQATFRARDVRVIMPAQPGFQSYPNSRRVLLIALFAGLGFGVGGAYLIEMLKAGFTSSREIEDALGIPVLASVRKMKKSELVMDGKSIPIPFYQVHNPLSAFSESMRTLRSGIHMSDVDQPPKVIHVTSARPSEGKTTIAMSIAISAALAGQKVVLVDADLRHPAVSRFFKLEKEKGLVDLLLGATTIDEVLKVRQDLSLTVIPAGSKSLNPPDVLGSERMKALVSMLKQTFDYVVLDTPPVGPVVDPIIVANLADKTIFIVQWASTPREAVETSVQRISVHKRVAGVVLNSVNQNRAKKYGGEYYYGKNYEKYYSK